MSCPHELQSLRVAPWVVLAQVGCLLCSGCLAGPTVVPTPQNQAQVASCERNANLHNAGWIVAGVLGAGGAGLGTAATLTSSETTQKTEAAVGIGVGVAAVGIAALNAITAQEYATQHCTDLTGALPSP